MTVLLKRKGPGSLLLICCLLFGSAAIRLGLEAGQAVAREGPFLETRPQTAKIETAPKEADREGLAKMLQAFQDREARISELEQNLAVRERAVDVATEEIERRLDVLKSAEESLRSLLTIASTAAEDDLATLTSVYENMKPKDAANLFEEMEPAFAAGFLGRMRPDAAAGIMSGLSPKAAYSISVILAGRNADVPKG